MNTLITGGTGFIGLNFIKMFSDKERIITFSRAPQTDFIKLFLGQQKLKKVTLIKGDVTKLTDLLEAVKKYNVDRIVHMAAILPPVSEENPMYTLRINVEGAINVLETARILDVKRVVFLSSVAVYGQTPDQLIDEDYAKNPINIYGLSKLAGELCGLNYSRKYNLDFIALRLSTVYGPGGKGLIEKMIVGAFMGKYVKVPRRGDEGYEPVYVKDVVKSIMLALHGKDLKNRIFNIGGSEMCSLEEIASVIRKYIPHAKIEFGRESRLHKVGKLNLKRAMEELGYKPVYSVKDGVKNFIEWLRQQANLISP